MPQQRIEFDGQVHEFPEDFTQEDIRRALSRAGTPSTPQTPDDPGDVILGNIGTAATYLKGAAKNVPKSAGNAILSTILAAPLSAPYAIVKGLRAGTLTEDLKGAAREQLERFKHPIDTFQADPVGFALDVAPGAGVVRVAANVVGRGAKAGGASLLRSALKPTKTMQKHHPGTDWGRELGDAGINVTRTGAQKATEEIDDLLSQVSQLERDAGAAGQTARMQTVLTPVVEAIRAAQQDAAVLPAVRRQMGQIAREFYQNAKAIDPAGHGLTYPIDKLHTAKTTLGSLSKQARHEGSPMHPTAASTFDHLREGAKRAIEEQIPEVASLNKKASNLIKLREAVRDRLKITENADPVGLPASIGIATGGVSPANLAKQAAVQAIRSPTVRSHTGMGLYRAGKAIGDVPIPPWLRNLLAVIEARNVGGASPLGDEDR